MRREIRNSKTNGGISHFGQFGCPKYGVARPSSNEGHRRPLSCAHDNVFGKFDPVRAGSFLAHKIINTDEEPMFIMTYGDKQERFISNLLTSPHFDAREHETKQLLCSAWKHQCELSAIALSDNDNQKRTYPCFSPLKGWEMWDWKSKKGWMEYLDENLKKWREWCLNRQNEVVPHPG